MDTQKQKRSAFSGKIGFVLSAAGASVGLGNIWRFPYLAAKYGGGIFLLVYIVLAVTFGYTMIVAETALGRICAMPTVSCPPAIPIVVSGEVIPAQALPLFARYGIGRVAVVKD